MTSQVLPGAPSPLGLVLRPLGYALLALVMLGFAAGMVALPVVAGSQLVTGEIDAADLTVSGDPNIAEVILLWLVVPPVGALLFVILPWAPFALGMLCLAYTGQSLLPRNASRRITHLVSHGASTAWLQPRIPGPAILLFTALGRLCLPDKWLYAAALVMTLGAGIAVLGGEGAPLVVGGVILIVGLGFYLPALVRRLRVELAKRTIEHQ